MDKNTILEFCFFGDRYQLMALKNPNKLVKNKQVKAAFNVFMKHRTTLSATNYMAQIVENFEQFLEYIHDKLQPGKLLALLFKNKQFLGWFCVGQWGNMPALSFWIDPSQQQSGVALETISFFLKYYQRTLQPRELVWSFYESNQRSRHLANKLGFPSLFYFKKAEPNAPKVYFGTKDFKGESVIETKPYLGWGSGWKVNQMLKPTKNLTVNLINIGFDAYADSQKALLAWFKTHKLTKGQVEVFFNYELCCLCISYNHKQSWVVYSFQQLLAKR